MAGGAAKRRALAPGAVLAALALALAVVAPLVGHADAPGQPGVAELSRELAGGGPLVDAVMLAEWIRDRRPLTLLDARDSSAFIRFAIPTARNVAYRDLVRAVPDTATTIVLYDDGAGAAVRGWLLLRRLGHADVRILEGGVVGWIEGIVSPVLPADTPEERERYRRVAAVSRYFGGVPRIGEPPPRADVTAEQAVQLLSRRGCY